MGRLWGGTAPPSQKPSYGLLQALRWHPRWRVATGWLFAKLRDLDGLGKGDRTRAPTPGTQATRPAGSLPWAGVRGGTVGSGGSPLRGFVVGMGCETAWALQCSRHPDKALGVGATDGDALAAFEPFLVTESNT